MDLSERDACVGACEGAREVYNLAADMGGMGFIERFRVECLRSILITANLIEAAYRAGVEAKDCGKHEIVIWGNGTATRSFMYIDDCVQGIDMLMHCDDLIATRRIERIFSNG